MGIQRRGERDPAKDQQCSRFRKHSLVYFLHFFLKGIAIGADRLGSVEFEGTIFVNTISDNDWLGSVFSFQVKYLNVVQNLCANFRILQIFISL